MSPPAAPPASASEALKTLDPLRVERFRRDVERLIAQVPSRHGAVAAHSAGADAARGGYGSAENHPLRGGPSTTFGDPPPCAGEDASKSRFSLAVSGGADSMAMLLLAAAAFPRRVLAATVDHGLRAEAAQEAALVASVCARLGVPHATLSPLAPIVGSSLQKQARAARYAALEAWTAGQGMRLLLTAHHADDQAETLLMRLNRSSGTAGLSGIRPIRFDGACAVLRPLLRWRRSELRAIVEATGTPWIEDPSNSDPRYDRTRYREFLAGQTMLDALALAEAAAHIGQAEEALCTLTLTQWHERWDADRRALRAGDLPREVRRRLVRMAIEEVRDRQAITEPAFSPAANIEPLLDALEAGRRGTQAGLVVTPRTSEWHFAPAPPRRSH